MLLPSISDSNLPAKCNFLRRYKCLGSICEGTELDTPKKSSEKMTTINICHQKQKLYLTASGKAIALRDY